MTRVRRGVAALLLVLLLFPWYRMVSGRGSGPAVEQTLRLGEIYYASLWLGAALSAAAVLLLSRIVRPGSLDRLWRPGRRLVLGTPPLRYAAALAAAAFFLSAWTSAGVLDRKPALLDGVAQLVHARYLASGALSGPALDAPEFWQFQFMVPSERGWVSQYPPGFAAMLALGVRAGAAWLIGPLLLAAAVFVVARIGERLFPDDPAVARGGAALAAVSPMLVFHAAAYMSHVLALALAAVAVFAALRAVEGGSRWALLGGGALGALFATRPYTAVVFGSVAVVGALVAGAARRSGARAWAPEVLAALAGAAPFVLGVLSYNRRFFGSPFRFGYEAAEGPGHRLGFHVDPWGNPYGPAEALGYTSADLHGLGVELFQTPIPVVLGVALYLLIGRRVGAAVAIAAAWALLPVAAHALYWHHDLFMGPRLLYEAVPGWCFLVAAAGAAAVRALPREGRRFLRFGLVTREGVAATFALALLVGVSYAGPRKLASYRSEGARTGMTAAAPVFTRPALVFVHGSWEDRLAARLDGVGMRVDSIRAALAHNPTCRVELYVRRLEAAALTRPPGGAPDVRSSLPDPGSLAFRAGEGAPLLELPMPSGSIVRAHPGETLDPVCEREAASDFGGIAGLPPLLWQGDLPGLEAGGAMFVRDLGPERNQVLVQLHAAREPLLLVRREAGLRLLPYEEGMAALWSGPATSAASP